MSEQITLFDEPLGVDDRCAVGDSTYSHGLGVGAVEDLNAHLSGLFAERDVVDADGSEAAVLDLLDLGAVNRDISGVCLLKNDREVVYNVVVGEVVDAVNLRSQSCGSLRDISRAGNALVNYLDALLCAYCLEGLELRH